MNYVKQIIRIFTFKTDPFFVKLVENEVAKAKEHHLMFDSYLQLSKHALLIKDYEYSKKYSLLAALELKKADESIDLAKIYFKSAYPI